MDLTKMWFQQDGATCHISWETLNLLIEKLGGFIISRDCAIHWLPRLCDLPPFYEALCAVKLLLCANKLQAIGVRNPPPPRIQEIEPHLCYPKLVDL